MKAGEQMEQSNAGMHLLKKGKTGILKMVFSRTGLVMLLLFLNAGWLFATFARFRQFIPHIYGVTAVFVVCMVLYLINSRMDASAKITWLIVIMLLPVFGALLYLFTCADLGHRAESRKLQKVYRETPALPDDGTALQELRGADPGAAALSSYITAYSGSPLSRNRQAIYFPLGEDMFRQMLAELEKAEKSIYLEYFIVDEGVMWGQILEILTRKAAQGLDVRVMYDGTCELQLLPRSYPRKLRALGIACQVFAPVTPFVSTHYNYRDHRKILAIDGKVAFTGGVNLADEYINARPMFGHWKDTAVMLRGEAAQTLQRMFLQMWNLEQKNVTFPQSLPWDGAQGGDGFVQPYFDDPLDHERVGRQVYMDILNRAHRYVHIMTPYLILDGELENALTYAAKRGVEVTVLLPGIPDKKIPYAMAKSHYPALVEAGVNILEYTPGFVHAKVMVCDDREAVVGTINLDYRSLYHHFECAAYLYGVACIGDIEKDFCQYAAQSRLVTSETIRKEKLFYKLAGKLLKPIGTLM